MVLYSQNLIAKHVPLQMNRTTGEHRSVVRNCSTSIGQEANFKVETGSEALDALHQFEERRGKAREVGRSLDLKIAFGEMDVLHENLELIRWQMGLERVEVLLASS